MCAPFSPPAKEWPGDAQHMEALQAALRVRKIMLFRGITSLKNTVNTETESLTQDGPTMILEHLQSDCTGNVWLLLN